MRSVTIGATSNPFREDLRDRYERGFHHIEIRMPEMLLIGRRVEIAGELERNIDEYDLEIVSLHVPELRSNGQPVDFASFDEENRRAGVEIVEAALNVAASIGAPRVVVTLPPFIDQNQIQTQDPTTLLTLARHRTLRELERFADQAASAKILLCLKNAPPLVEPGPAIGAFHGLSTVSEVYETIRKLGAVTRAWMAFDIPNAYLFRNAWRAAHEGTQKLAWIEQMGIEISPNISRTMRDLAEFTEIFYLSNVRGFTMKGLLPKEGEMDLKAVYKQILSYIFPKRIIVLDVKEETDDKAANTELMFAYIREINKEISIGSSKY
ncbi:MAG: sugar phosphate isomerase/epimerase family protein [Candidatus Heimdallarchaeota archaeon]